MLGGSGFKDEVPDGHVLNNLSHSPRKKLLVKPVFFAMKGETVVARYEHLAAPVIATPADRIVVHRRLRMLPIDDAAASAKSR